LDGDTDTFGWNFDILIDDMLGASAQTQITIQYSYRDITPLPVERRTGTFNIYIWLSSLFDEGNTEEIEGLADLYEDEPDDDDYFEAGDVFSNTALDMYNPSQDDFEDLTVELTPPAGITLSGDGTCWMPEWDAGTWNTDTFYFRSSINQRLAPGMHEGTAVFSYLRLDSNIMVTEPAHPINWPVDFNFRDTDPGGEDADGNDLPYSENQIKATNVTITDIGEAEETPANTSGNGTRQQDIFALPSDTYEQSSFSDKLITIDVTVQNNGNCDLYNVEFSFDPTAPGDWDWFRNPNFFWPIITGPEYDTTRLVVDRLNVSTSTTFTIQVIAVKEVPIGEHRLPIVYNGFYFDDGSLGDATEFTETNDGNDLLVYFSIFVTDDNMDCRIDDVLLDSDEYVDDLTDLWIDVDLENLEGYAFIDIMATADFTGTPFYAPLITDNPNEGNAMVQVVEADKMIKAWGPYDDVTPSIITFEFNVDMYVEPVPDMYPFTISLTAIIEETLEQIETTLTGTFSITGYGPRIWIEAFTTSDIEAGNYFDLNLTISNDGDDTLRDAWAYIGADGVEPVEWDIICDIIGQIQRNGETDQLNATGGIWLEPEQMVAVNEGGFEESYEWEGAQVTLEDLDIDSAKELIALNLYIEGVYSSPSAVITLIWIGEIAPGESVQVDYQMIADKDMVDGKPYVITVDVWGIDSESDEYDMGGDGYGAGYGVDITVKTAKDSAGSYDPVEPDLFMGGMQIMGLVLFIIIVVAILFYVIRKVVFPPKKEEPRPPQ